MTAYLTRHLQVLLATFGQMARSPGATLMTIAAIGITLALPTLLYLATVNLDRASAGFNRGAPVTLFLRQDLEPDSARELARKLGQQAGVEDSSFIDADEALAEFKLRSGLGAAVEMLGQNPLPHSVVLYLTADLPAAAAAQLLRDMEAHPDVALAQSDLQWLRRLQAIISLVQRGAVLLAILLAVAVVVIISNTVRLAIVNRRDEIVIIKLIGGTDGFVRRPFLYSGFLQGLFGALVAWILIAGCLQLLGVPVAELSRLYGTEFRLTGLSASDALVVLLSGGLLGWLASRWAVGRHLSQIEPQ